MILARVTDRGRSETTGRYGKRECSLLNLCSCDQTEKEAGRPKQ